VRREDCQEVGASHSSDEAGERPSGPRGAKEAAALWTGSWNHAEDAVPQSRVTVKQPDRVRDSDPQPDEPGAFDVHARISGSPGWATTPGDPAETHEWDRAKNTG
jgi:hypothetical protein